MKEGVGEVVSYKTEKGSIESSNGHEDDLIIEKGNLNKEKEDVLWSLPAILQILEALSAHTASNPAPAVRQLQPLVRGAELCVSESEKNMQKNLTNSDRQLRKLERALTGIVIQLAKCASPADACYTEVELPLEGFTIDLCRCLKSIQVGPATQANSDVLSLSSKNSINKVAVSFIAISKSYAGTRNEIALRYQVNVIVALHGILTTTHDVERKRAITDVIFSRLDSALTFVYSLAAARIMNATGTEDYPSLKSRKYLESPFSLVDGLIFEKQRLTTESIRKMVLNVVGALSVDIKNNFPVERELETLVQVAELKVHYVLENAEKDLTHDSRALQSLERTLLDVVIALSPSFYGSNTVYHVESRNIHLEDFMVDLCRCIKSVQASMLVSSDSECWEKSTGHHELFPANHARNVLSAAVNSLITVNERCKDARIRCHLEHRAVIIAALAGILDNAQDAEQKSVITDIIAKHLEDSRALVDNLLMEKIMDCLELARPLELLRQNLLVPACTLALKQLHQDTLETKDDPKFKLDLARLGLLQATGSTKAIKELLGAQHAGLGSSLCALQENVGNSLKSLVILEQEFESALEDSKNDNVDAICAIAEQVIRKAEFVKYASELLYILDSASAMLQKRLANLAQRALTSVFGSMALLAIPGSHVESSSYDMPHTEDHTTGSLREHVITQDTVPVSTQQDVYEHCSVSSATLRNTPSQCGFSSPTGSRIYFRPQQHSVEQISDCPISAINAPLRSLIRPEDYDITAAETIVNVERGYDENRDESPSYSTYDNQMQVGYGSSIDIINGAAEKLKGVLGEELGTLMSFLNPVDLNPFRYCYIKTTTTAEESPQESKIDTAPTASRKCTDKDAFVLSTNSACSDVFESMAALNTVTNHGVPVNNHIPANDTTGTYITQKTDYVTSALNYAARKSAFVPYLNPAKRFPLQPECTGVHELVQLAEAEEGMPKNKVVFSGPVSDAFFPTNLAAVAAELFLYRAYSGEDVHVSNAISISGASNEVASGKIRHNAIIDTGIKNLVAELKKEHNESIFSLPSESGSSIHTQFSEDTSKGRAGPVQSVDSTLAGNTGAIDNHSTIDSSRGVSHCQKKQVIAESITVISEGSAPADLPAIERDSACRDVGNNVKSVASTSESSAPAASTSPRGTHSGRKMTTQGGVDQGAAPYKVKTRHAEQNTEKKTTRMQSCFCCRSASSKYHDTYVKSAIISNIATKTGKNSVRSVHNGNTEGTRVSPSEHNSTGAEGRSVVTYCLLHRLVYETRKTDAQYIAKVANDILRALDGVKNDTDLDTQNAGIITTARESLSEFLSQQQIASSGKLTPSVKDPLLRTVVSLPQCIHGTGKAQRNNTSDVIVNCITATSDIIKTINASGEVSGDRSVQGTTKYSADCRTVLSVVANLCLAIANRSNVCTTTNNAGLMLRRRAICIASLAGVLCEEQELVVSTLLEQVEAAKGTICKILESVEEISGDAYKELVAFTCDFAMSTLDESKYGRPEAYKSAYRYDLLQGACLTNALQEMLDTKPPYKSKLEKCVKKILEGLPKVEMSVMAFVAAGEKADLEKIQESEKALSTRVDKTGGLFAKLEHKVKNYVPKNSLFAHVAGKAVFVWNCFYMQITRMDPAKFHNTPAQEITSSSTLDAQTTRRSCVINLEASSSISVQAVDISGSSARVVS